MNYSEIPIREPMCSASFSCFILSARIFLLLSTQRGIRNVLVTWALIWDYKQRNWGVRYLHVTSWKSSILHRLNYSVNEVCAIPRLVLMTNFSHMLWVWTNSHFSLSFGWLKLPTWLTATTTHPIINTSRIPLRLTALHHNKIPKPKMPYFPTLKTAALEDNCSITEN